MPLSENLVIALFCGLGVLLLAWVTYPQAVPPNPTHPPRPKEPKLQECFVCGKDRELVATVTMDTPLAEDEWMTCKDCAQWMRLAVIKRVIEQQDPPKAVVESKEQIIAQALAPFGDRLSAPEIAKAMRTETPEQGS